MHKQSLPEEDQCTQTGHLHLLVCCVGVSSDLQPTLWQTLWQQQKTVHQTLKAPQPQVPLTQWPKPWLHQTQLEEPKAVAAQNPMIGGLMMMCLENGGRRTNWGVQSEHTSRKLPPGSIRVLVPQKSLVIRGQ